MSTITRRAALAALPIALLAPHARAQGNVITGTASYRERIALRPGAVLEVELADISRADAPSGRIALARIPVEGQVPIRFALSFDPARIEPRHRYALRARLLHGERTIFRSDSVVPVLTQGAGREAEILLVRARAPEGRGGGEGEGAAGLVGPLWVAEDIGGRGVLDRLRSTITFGADGRVQGMGGCNRFNGGYTLAGASLRFGRMARTERACVPAAMDQEQRFHATLATVQGWRIENGILHLTGEGGTTVLRLAPGR